MGRTGPSLTTSTIRQLVAETVKGWGRHYDVQLAAALAFFSALSLPPLLALTLSAAERIFGQTEVAEFLYARLSETAGADAAALLRSAVEAVRVTGAGGMSTVVSVLGLLVAASGLVYQAQAALAHVFEWRRDGGIRHTLLLRAVGLAALAAVAALFVALFAALTIIDALEVFGAASGLVSGLAIAFAAFGATVLSYRWLSGRAVGWVASLLGAALTTVAVMIARWGFGIYLTYARPGTLYGSASSIFALLLWVYAVALMYLIGAEVARAWSVVRG